MFDADAEKLYFQMQLAQKYKAPGTTYRLLVEMPQGYDDTFMVEVLMSLGSELLCWRGGRWRCVVAAWMVVKRYFFGRVEWLAILVDVLLTL